MNEMKERILLTPEMARELLAHNYHKNRKIRKSAVDRIKQDILADRWNPELSFYQDPIMVTEDGILMNGQHRCMAVVQANRAVSTYWQRNVPESIYKMLDGGTVRSAADYCDAPNKIAVAALAKIMCAVEDGNAPLASAIKGTVFGRISATRMQIIEKMNSDGERLQSFVRAGQRAGKYLYNKNTVISTALFLIDFTGRDEVVERFVQESSQLATDSQQINALRAYMGKCLINKNFKTDYKWVLSCVLYTYEAFRDDTEIHSFNRIGSAFSKYDKYVFDAREKGKEMHHKGADCEVE